MNIWAVIVAAVSSLFLGGLWYSPVLFGRTWNAENCGEKPPGHPAKVFGISLLFSLISAFAFASWLGAAPPLDTALKAGATVGFAFVAASFGINYQFAQRSTKLWLIDGGYHTAQFILSASFSGCGTDAA